MASVACAHCCTATIEVLHPSRTMKTTDWYLRTLLTLITSLLLVIAAELRGIYLSASAIATSRLTPELADPYFRSRRVSLRTPEAEPPKPVMDVRIVGYGAYRYNKNTKEMDFDDFPFGRGHYAAGTTTVVANQLPVSLDKK